MKLHRYFIDDKLLDDTLIIDDKDLIKQWSTVLRYSPGRQVRLFNTSFKEALYEIATITKKAVELTKIEDVRPLMPKREVYLCFSLLKKDKNEWILQKATELGVSHFLPLLTDRTEKTGWNEERAKKIVIEAVEQCGRVDIPELSDPKSIFKAIDLLTDKTVHLLVAEQTPSKEIGNKINDKGKDSVGILIGPEGGWSDEEKHLFADKNLQYLSLSDFTLRAETAAITAVGKLL